MLMTRTQTHTQHGQAKRGAAGFCGGEKRSIGVDMRGVRGPEHRKAPRSEAVQRHRMYWTATLISNNRVSWLRLWHDLCDRLASGALVMVAPRLHRLRGIGSEGTRIDVYGTSRGYGRSIDITVSVCSLGTETARRGGQLMRKQRRKMPTKEV